jgi:site-specific DNA recombinase
MTGRVGAQAYSGRLVRKVKTNGKPVIDVYGRISSETDEDRARRQFSSPEAQVELLCEEVVRRGGIVGKIHMDVSLSAWRKGVVRPDWIALMERLASGACDGFIVWDINRFSRKVMEGEQLVELGAGGTLVWSLYGAYDLTTADGRSQFRDAVQKAAYESDKNSERTKEGKRRKAERGRSNGTKRAFGCPGLGPKPEGWEPGDPRPHIAEEAVAAEREVLREVARRLLDGESTGAMVDLLNARGFTSARGNRWTRDVLVRTLQRPSRAGFNTWDGEIIGTLPGEAVLDVETWERLRSLFASRKTGRPVTGRYLLTGLIVCGRCEKPMVGSPSARLYADGEPQRRYWCRREGYVVGCGRNFASVRWLDSMVEAAVMRRLADPKLAERVAKRSAASRAETEKITGEIARLEDDSRLTQGSPFSGSGSQCWKLPKPRQQRALIPQPHGRRRTSLSGAGSSGASSRT